MYAKNTAYFYEEEMSVRHYELVSRWKKIQKSKQSKIELISKKV